MAFLALSDEKNMKLFDIFHPSTVTNGSLRDLRIRAANSATYAMGRTAARGNRKRGGDRPTSAAISSSGVSSRMLGFVTASRVTRAYLYVAASGVPRNNVCVPRRAGRRVPLPGVL